MIKIIVFDFDGTLVDSNEIKEDLFFHVGEEYFPESSSIMSKILNDSSYKTRKDIFREFYNACISQKTNYSSASEVVTEMIDSYTHLAEKSVIKAEEIEGAGMALERLNNNYPLFINSATPSNTLKNIIYERDWLHYFKEIYGSDNSKVDNLKKICLSMNEEPANALMIGDSEADYDCSRSIGSEFFGYKYSYNDEHVVLHSLSEIESRISCLNQPESD